MSDIERQKKIEELKKELKKEMQIDFKIKDLEKRANMSRLKIISWGAGMFFGLIIFLAVIAANVQHQEDLMYLYAKKVGATERIKQKIDCSHTVGNIATLEKGVLKCSGPEI